MKSSIAGTKVEKINVKVFFSYLLEIFTAYSCKQQKKLQVFREVTVIQPGMKCLGYETTIAKQPYLIDYQLFMSQSREGAK